MVKSRNEPGEGPRLKPTEVNLTTPSRESRSWEHPADAATGPKIVQLLDLVVVEGETGRRDSH